MTDYYVNPDAGSGGSGLSELSPYDDFTEIDAWSGDRSGDRILLRAGTTINDSLAISDCSNLSVDKYGDGDRPIVDASGATNAVVATLNATNIRHIHARNGTGSSLLATTGTGNSTFESLECSGGGTGTPSGGNSGINIVGSGLGSEATGIVIRDVYSHDNKNNGIEISWLDGYLIEDCQIDDVQTGNSIELWLGCINGTIRRNKANGALSFVKAFAQATGSHDTNTIQNNIGWNLTNRAIWAEEGINWTVQNNSMVSAFSFFKANASQDGHTLAGNIGVQTSTTNNNPLIDLFATTSGCTLDKNIWYHTERPAGNWYMRWNGTVYNTFALWQSNSSQDANSLYEDPAFIDQDNGDLRLSSSSSGLYAVLDAATGLTYDANKDARYGGVDVGALQYVRVALSKSSVMVN